MNNLDLWANDVQRHEHHPGADKRHPSPGIVTTDGKAAAATDSPQQSRSWLATGGIVVLFWIAYFAAMTAMANVSNPNETRDLYSPRALVALAGVLISFCMIAMQSRLREASLGARAGLALVMALAATALHYVINTKVFHFYFPRGTPDLEMMEFVSDYSWRVWIWCAMSGMILAMSYAADIRERERRILGLQALAHSAQLRALRFQLNPHFLFNALNSIAGLISAKRVDEAESMTEDLADFLRQTLALEPQKLITLEEELQLQQLYLEIEKKRFPDRLRVKVDVPDDLRDALVPSLITQPLIENSIKYAVARSTRPVDLTISARRVADQLDLTVADNGCDSNHAPNKGAHLGLRNVAERVRMHFGDRGFFTAEAGPNGGFCNRIVAPLEMRE